MGRAKREFAQGKNHTIAHSEINAKITRVYDQRGETCTRDSHLFTTDIQIMLTSRLNKKKRFLEWAAYTSAQSKEFAKTGQRSLHDYFDQNAPKPTKEYIKNTEESMITRRRQTQTKISVRYIS